MINNKLLREAYFAVQTRKQELTKQGISKNKIEMIKKILIKYIGLKDIVSIR